MTGVAFDCRSYDLNGYANSILKDRVDRFSTVYACCFITSAEAATVCDRLGAHVDGRPPPDMLLTASSTGDIKLYRLPDLVQRWTAGQQSAPAACSWAAHQGPAYCLAKSAAPGGGEIVLFSGGDDGYVRGWRLSDVLRAAQQQSQQQPGSVGGGQARQQQQQQAEAGPGCEVAGEVRPCLAVRLPRAESPLAAISLPPAVQALAVAEGGATLHIGCSDGGVHSLDVASGSLRQGQGQGQGGGGHAAAVLALDHHAASACLASGSEDGTIRLWDTRGGGSCCVRTLDAGSGRQVAGAAEALRCLRSPPVSCLRFEPSGSWLLCGQGGGAGAGAGQAGGSLAMWDLGMAQRAKQTATSFVPQAMLVLPSEVLVGGSEAALCRYSAALEGPTRQPLATRSVFALDCHPDSGALAAGGAGASLELLSKYGKKTGAVFYASEED